MVIVTLVINIYYDYGFLQIKSPLKLGAFSFFEAVPIHKLDLRIKQQGKKERKIKQKNKQK